MGWQQDIIHELYPNSKTAMTCSRLKRIHCWLQVVMMLLSYPSKTTRQVYPSCGHLDLMGIL